MSDPGTHVRLSNERGGCHQGGRPTPLRWVPGDEEFIELKTELVASSTNI